MKKINNQEGAAAIEFAIILPLLLTVLFGIIEFSIAFYDKAMITNASREGARTGIVLKPEPRETTAENTEIENTVSFFLTDKLITLGTSNAPVVTINREGFTTGDSLSVTVAYNYDYYVLPAFVVGVTGPVTLNATTVMKME